MTLHSCSDSVIASLELDKASIRLAHPDWSDERIRLEWSRRKERILSYLINDVEIPRSMQLNFTAGPGSMLVQDGNLRPTNPDTSTCDLDAQCIVPAPMARTALSSSSFLGYWSNPSSASHSISGSSIGNKRGYDQVDMDYSASYTYGLVPWQRTTSDMASSIVSQNIDGIQTFEPGEYCSALSSDSNPAQAPIFVVKTQAAEGIGPAFPYANVSNSSPHSSSVHVAQGTGMPMPSLSPPSLPPSEVMSRQSSTTNASLIDGVDMLRVDSLSSAASNLPFAFEDLESSFLSCSTEKAADGPQLTVASSRSGNASPFNHVENVCTQLSFVNFESQHSAAVNEGSQPTRTDAVWSNISAAADMHIQRSFSTSSTSSSADGSDGVSSAHRKVIDRQRKHLENGRQAIAMKSTPSRRQMVPTSADTRSRPIRPLDPQLKRKAAITKAPYVRPSREKLLCNQCNEYPDGFKGDHELRRHCERAHSHRRKVWIITQPAARTEHWPEVPIDICKYCKNQKPFNIDYNAAAHLRRVHFRPCKRGRRARGDARESRAGKAGGDWPAIDWLKEQGWLTEIEVGDLPNPDARLGVEQQRLAADCLGFGAAFASTGA